MRLHNKWQTRLSGTVLRLFGLSAFGLVIWGLPGGAVALDEQACAEAIRAIMTDTRQDRPPVKHTSVTRFGEQETVSISWSTGFNQGVSGDAEGDPVSLFHDGAFYTTSDGGETWTLSRTYTQEEIDGIREGMLAQAASATGFACEMATAPEGLHAGREGMRYAVDYVLSGSGMAASTVYWVDPADGFVWRAENTFDMNGTAMQVIQDSEPAPDFVLPEP
jgi:ADP-ribose pyrophosphatase YjhB (NUDIX family)